MADYFLAQSREDYRQEEKSKMVGSFPTTFGGRAGHPSGTGLVFADPVHTVA